MKFTKKMSYYPADVLPVYEFNLPAGHSCHTLMYGDNFALLNNFKKHDLK